MFSKGRTYVNFLLPWTSPLFVVAHGGSVITRGIVEATKGERYDAFVWTGVDLLPHLMDALPSMSVGRVIVDFIDSPFLWAIRRKEHIFRIQSLERYERWKTSRWEGEIIRKVDGTIYISRVDADAVPSVHAPMGKRYVVPNGINVPSSTKTEPVSLPSPNIGFLGNMGYSPNIEAVEWLYNKVYGPLKIIFPDLTLVVIGRNPSPSIRELGDQPGVIVTGAVDDIWEYIHATDLFLFPLLRGAGLKNKILEVMYAGRPIVTTKIGNEGIDAVGGRDLILRETPDEFQREASRLLGSSQERARIGTSAKTFVKENFSWGGILRVYEDLVLGRLPEDAREGLIGGDPSPGVGGRR
jgi:glycosyltransferase involved in cell wall biosynthesis